MRSDSKSIMIQGTGSHVGKSAAVAAVCRILKQDGYNVCPFKSQNMALNSYVTAGGEEMGRAQVVQAEACGLEPEAYMNPILIKPIADIEAQIIFMGKVVKNMSASEYNRKKVFYLERIKEIIDDLKKRFDCVVIEGAGSPAEINLLKNDIVNMKAAEISESPVILVGDVDRGGIFASFYGTVKLLPAKYRRYIKGLLVNKFRGDIDLLKPGNDYISRKLKIPVVGTIPYYNDIYIEEEDSVNLEREISKKIVLDRAGGIDRKRVIIGVVYVPHISNFTDFNVFEMEKEVSLIYIKNKQELRKLKPHMIIIPGSKSTIGDLLYLRKSGLEEEIKSQYQKGVAIFGICGGYQILGREITDKFRSESLYSEDIDGFGLMDINTEFLKHKSTCQVEFKLNENIFNHGPDLRMTDRKEADIKAETMRGYEIHMGISTPVSCKSGKLIPLFKVKRRGNTDGDFNGNDGFITFGKKDEGVVMGTYIHGAFDNQIFRKFILSLIKEKNDIRAEGDIIITGAADETPSYKIFKQEQYDRLANVFRENMNMKLFYKILRYGL
ncbi:MAG: cobyric acid synthase [Actinomycetota bacterium]|nr:cobyric acid synthase [Actinomycetota bacterium]